MNDAIKRDTGMVKMNKMSCISLHRNSVDEEANECYKEGSHYL